MGVAPTSSERNSSDEGPTVDISTEAVIALIFSHGDAMGCLGTMFEFQVIDLCVKEGGRQKYWLCCLFFESLSCFCSLCIGAAFSFQFQNVCVKSHCLVFVCLYLIS